MVSAVCTPTISEAAAAPPVASVRQPRAVNWRLIAQCVVLLVATCACYWPALNGEFQWDDGLLVKDNELIKSLAGLRDIWFSTRPYDFFPLTYTTFWLEWPLWGDDPTGYHLVNLALHLAGAGLLWKLLLELRLPGAWFGALLFALHPVNVASVAWISERKNTLSMVFYLACLVYYARFDNPTDLRARRWRYGAALGFFVLAALSKSSVVMLPFVLLLLCWWRRGKLSWADLARSVPFFAVSLSCGLATMWFQYHRAIQPGYHAANHLPWLVRTLMTGHVAWFYLGKALLPVRLSMVYPRWTLGASSPGDYLPVFGWLAALCAAWVGRFRWGRGPFAVLAYFLITLAPVSGLMQMSFFSFSYVSDHLMHLALVGIIVAISAGLGAWHARGGVSARLVLAVMVLWVVAFCVATPYRADQFGSNRRLWETALGVAPRCFAVYNNLGADAQAHGRIAEAEADYREAVRLEPRSFSTCNNLATALRLQGKWRQAGVLYQAILRLEPNAQCYNNLAVVFLELGETDKARTQLEHALALAPTMDSAYFNLFRTEHAEHRLPAAAAALRGCLRCNPADAVAMTCLASLSLEQNPDAAEARRIDPLIFESAIALADHACQLTSYRDPRCLEMLAKVLLASGRRAAAVTQAQKAVAAAVALHQTALADECAAYAASLAASH